MRKQIGDFEVDVWTASAPVWIHIRYKSRTFNGPMAEFKFSADELPDLAYAVECAARATESKD